MYPQPQFQASNISNNYKYTVSKLTTHGLLYIDYPAQIAQETPAAKAHGYSGKLQSIGLLPRFWSALLHLEKVLQPCQKRAESGDGCADSITVCFILLMILPFFFAKPPHSKNTNPVRWLDRYRTTASVKSCQPNFEWEFASPRRTCRIKTGNIT